MTDARPGNRPAAGKRMIGGAATGGRGIRGADWPAVRCGRGFRARARLPTPRADRVLAAVGYLSVQIDRVGLVCCSHLPGAQVGHLAVAV